MLLTQDVALKGYFRERIVLGAEHLPQGRAVPSCWLPPTARDGMR